MYDNEQKNNPMNLVNDFNRTIGINLTINGFSDYDLEHIRKFVNNSNLISVCAHIYDGQRFTKVKKSVNDMSETEKLRYQCLILKFICMDCTETIRNIKEHYMEFDKDFANVHIRDRWIVRKLCIMARRNILKQYREHKRNEA